MNLFASDLGAKYDLTEKSVAAKDEIAFEVKQHAINPPNDNYADSIRILLPALSKYCQHEIPGPPCERGDAAR